MMLNDAYGAAAANARLKKVLGDNVKFPISAAQLSNLVYNDYIKIEKIFVFPSSK